jgi:hypothetical protein
MSEVKAQGFARPTAITYIGPYAGTYGVNAGLEQYGANLGLEQYSANQEA